MKSSPFWLLAAGLLLTACGDAPQPAGTETAQVPQAAQEDAAAAAAPDDKPQAGDAVRFPHQASDLKADPAVIYGELENGLRYAVMENDTPTGTAALRLRVDMGSLMESADQRGLAHFIEHMAFNGSENVAEGEMVKILEREGLAFGPDTNAYTSYDETVYMLDLPETDAETVETGMFLMSEIDDLLLDAEAIDRERGIVQSEKRARNTPAFRAFLAQSEFLYPEALFTERTPIGTDEVLARAPREEFVELYRSFYRPDRVFFSAVGDFDAATMERRIQDAFGDWTVEGEPGEDPQLDPPEDRGLEAGYFQDPAIPTSVSLNAVRPYAEEPDTAETRLENLTRAIGNNILSRRFDTLSRQPGAVLLGGGAGYSSLLETAETATVNIVTEPDQWKQALTLAETELRRALEHGFTEAELAEQMANIQTAYENAADQAATRQTGQLANALVSAFGSESVFMHPDAALRLFNEMKDKITLDAVEAAFRKQWEGEQPLIFLSTAAELDDPEDAILQVYRDSAARPVEPPEAEAAGEFAYDDFGQPGEVVWREEIEDLGITQVRFDNNVMLNIKPTDFQEDAVLMKLRFGGGILETDPQSAASRFLYSNAFALGGTGEHSLDDIQRLMAGKSVSTNFYAETDAFGASAGTTPEDMDTQLKLWTAYLADPGYRPESIAQFHKLYNVFYDTLGGTPEGVFQRDAASLLYSGDPRFAFPKPGAVEALTLADARGFIDPSRKNAALEIGIVGDITVEEAIESVAATLGALPERALERKSYEDARQVSFPAPGETVTFRHEGEADRALAQVYWPAPDGRDAAQARALSLLAEIFQLKLTDRIREEEAAAYSPAAGYSGSRLFEDYGYFQVSLDLKPADVDSFFGVVNEIAASLASGEISEDELQRARRPVLESIEENQEQNGYWLGVVGESQTDPGILARHRSRTADYEAVTLDQLKRLAKAYLQPSNAYRIQILPPESG